MTENEVAEVERPMTGPEIMLMELQSNFLTVVLVPCKRFVNECGCIRVAASKNAAWYRKFCANHGSSRRRKNTLHDTCIKRANTVRALENIIAGKPAGIYEDELKQIARRIAL